MENIPQNENFQSNPTSETPPAIAQHIAPEKPKRKLWKKILIWFFAVMLFLIILFYSLPHILGLFYKDIASVNDSDLRITPEVVSKTDNAYFDYVKLSGKVVSTVDGKEAGTYLSGSDWDQTFVDTLLNQNLPALQIFAESLRKAKYQDPVFSDYNNLTLEAETFPLGDVRDISKIMSVLSANLSRSGNLPEALAIAFEITDTGDKIEKSNGNLLNILSGIAIKQIGLERIQRLIKSPSVSPEAASIYRSKLESYRNNKEGIANAMKVGYISQANTISKSINDAVIKAGIDPVKLRNNFYYQPNNTKLLLADSMRKNIAYSKMTCDQLKEIKDPEREKISALSLYFTPNPIGRILVNVMSIPLSSQYLKDCEQDKMITDLESSLAN
jgi:hypothetical protein